MVRMLLVASQPTKYMNTSFETKLENDVVTLKVGNTKVATINNLSSIMRNKIPQFCVLFPVQYMNLLCTF